GCVAPVNNRRDPQNPRDEKGARALDAVKSRERRRPCVPRRRQTAPVRILIVPRPWKILSDRTEQVQEEKTRSREDVMPHLHGGMCRTILGDALVEIPGRQYAREHDGEKRRDQPCVRHIRMSTMRRMITCAAIRQKIAATIRYFPYG